MMSKITAIRNSIYRSTHMRKGNGISRMYHNLKNMTRLNAGGASIEMLLAMNAASGQRLFNTIFIGALTMYFVKKAKDYYVLKEALKEYYQPILDRARQIYGR